MIEYPSIINSSKAPRKPCVVFDKLDGSNFRAKWTKKKGFDTFGTRTQLIDKTTEYWGGMVKLFCDEYKELLEGKISREFRDEREVVVFGEFLGENSFAGRHEDEPHKIVFFDILVGHKNRKFLSPRDFIKFAAPIVEIPRIITSCNLSDELIKDVRANKFDTKEGVICKGIYPSGAFRGGVWMCKIKTQEYLDKLKGQFGDDWEKYAE